MMRLALAALVGIAAAPCASAAFAETAPSEVADEGARDPSLTAVRQRLIRIFETRNRAALTPYLHPQIVVGSGVIGVRHLGRITDAEFQGYGDRLKAGGRFARPGLFFVFYDAATQREADFRLNESKPEVHTLHGLAAVRATPNDRARKLNTYGMLHARLLPSPPGTPADWAYVESESGSEWKHGYIRKGDIASSITDGTLILLKQDGRWWIVRMCLC
jgi:hypothetical protein